MQAIKVFVPLVLRSALSMTCHHWARLGNAWGETGAARLATGPARGVAD